MKIQIDKKPIAISLIVVGFLFFIKLQFPLYKINSDGMKAKFKKGQIILVNKFAEIEKEDVIVIEKEGEVYLSRIVATTNDKVSCVNGNLLVNGQLVMLDYLLFEYRVYTKPEIQDSLVNGFKVLYPKREYLTFISNSKADSLREEKNVIKVDKVIHAKSNFRGDSASIDSRDNFELQTVPANSFWVMNDNRSNVNDSRKLGAINKQQIIGKVVYTFN